MNHIVKTFEQLCDNYLQRFKNSKDKVTLLKKEMELVNFIFNDEEWPLNGWYSNLRPIERELSLKEALNLSSTDILSLRRACDCFVVNGNDISRAGELSTVFLKDMNFPDNEVYEKGVYYANQAVAYFGYLQWLKEFKPGEIDSKRKFAVKYYAWYHKILVAIAKADPLIPGDKHAIQAIGKNKYGCGPTSGFYQHYIDFNIDKKETFVNSLGRDKKKWKDIIRTISDNDVDVIRYLESFPN